MSHTEQPFPIKCCPECFAGKCHACPAILPDLTECQCEGAFHERVRLETQCDSKIVSLQLWKDMRE